MPTVFQCLMVYCKQNNTLPLNRMQMQDLGQKVIHTWFSKKIKCTLSRVPSIEPAQTTSVISYPKFFTPVIMELIKQFYQSVVNTLSTPCQHPTTPLSTPTKVPANTYRTPSTQSIGTLTAPCQEGGHHLHGGGDVAALTRRRKRIPRVKKAENLAEL